ncbi:MAG: tripartite tricarboxylate transporter substrate binding protein [Burkholderiales bacterium]|nr:MAG: tripartite tricarboxylate transporter substrate binding protein [Burkholderiales bacterium]
MPRRPPMTHDRRRSLLRGALASAAMASLAPHVRAQGEPWPSRPIRILVGFAPGGSSDVVARLLAQRIQPLLGQPVVVENRVGAGGLVAAEAVARGPADGYTWLLLPSGHASQAAMLKRMPFDPLDGLAFVSTLTSYPMFVAVAPDSPIRTLRDLVDRARAAPGKVSFTSVGVGTAHHLIGEWIAAETGTELVHVPYKGSAAAFTDVAGGRVEVMVETATAALPFLRSGKLRAIAVTSEGGRALVPGVASAAETIPGLEYESWLGVAMAPGTPAPIVERVSQAVRTVLAQPETMQRLEDLGGRASPSSPDAFRARVQQDIARFRRVVATRNIPQE